nr:hypothetical protein [Acetobacter papayae]
MVLMVAAIGVVWHELRHLHMADIRQAMTGIPGWQMALAAACTLLSYFVLSFYDRLALIQVGYGHLPFRRAAFAAFCSYVLSHNLGFSAVSGAAVRYRLYRNWGVDSFAITQIIAFCSATYLLGAAALIGAVLIWEPAMLPGIGGRVPPGFLAVVGAGLWSWWRSISGCPSACPVCACGNGGLTCLRHVWRCCKRLWPRRKWPPRPVSPMLLPAGAGVDFGSFLAIYIAAYTAGLVASVPGGLGVFDGVMLLALGPYMLRRAFWASFLFSGCSITSSRCLWRGSCSPGTSFSCVAMPPLRARKIPTCPARQRLCAGPVRSCARVRLRFPWPWLPARSRSAVCC